MNKSEISLTPEFKAQATKAIIAIILFVIVYLLLLLLAIGLTALCVAGGIFIVAIRPMFLTIALGLGLASLGFFILIFLLKFIFKSNKVDRSHLVEIKKSDEPALFAMIDDIVRDVKTSYPKRVYLSSDVNAAVFYNSSFWSMFLPIRKNLQIGMGLVNTVTSQELKAILSHEFGHFSQRTMKIGSYVYNVNQVIFNMLFDNQSYQNLINRWANASGYFTIFVGIAIKIVGGIQYILRNMYAIVNKRYMALSREMEFHADAIAAGVTGYEPLKTSLLRMPLADTSFSNVLNFYSGKISENKKSRNIYDDQRMVLKFLAEQNNLPLVNDLPVISMEEQTKFDKSKLVIKDQWASHPTTKERVERLEQLNSSAANQLDSPANAIFSNISSVQEQLTGKVFETVTYQGETSFISADGFRQEYMGEATSNLLPVVYNGYYDNKNPAGIDTENIILAEDTETVEALFSDEKVNLVYTVIALENDIKTLTEIAANNTGIKTFDYDGVRYSRKEANEVIEQLKAALDKTGDDIRNNDRKIYSYFRKIEERSRESMVLKDLYDQFFAFDKNFESRYEHYTTILHDLEFVSVTTPFEQIRSNFVAIRSIEEKLKEEIRNILLDDLYKNELTGEIRKNLESYTSQELIYFDGSQYNDDNLGTMYSALHNYAFLLSRGYFLLKKRILLYQEELLNNR